MGLVREPDLGLSRYPRSAAHKYGGEELTRYERNKIVFTDALQNQEGERLRATVGHQMRSRWPDDIDFAGLEIHFLFRVLQEQPHVAFQDVESIGDIGVGVPRYLLGCGELQLRDAKAGARGVLGTTLDFVKVTGVPDWLRLVHVGLPHNNQGGPPINPTLPCI